MNSRHDVRHLLHIAQAQEQDACAALMHTVKPVRRGRSGTRCTTSVASIDGIDGLV
jgi:hypothetical protein